MKRTVFLLLMSALLGLSAMFSGCAGLPASNTNAVPPTEPGMVTPSADRLVPPSAPPVVSTADQETIVNDSGAFAFDLYQELRQGNDNLIFSPQSVFEAFAMLYTGACGQTETQIADVMHFTLPQERLHPAAQIVHKALVGENDAAKETEQNKGAFELSIANSLWGQKDYPIQPAFTDTLSRYYGAAMRAIDFRNAPDPARNTINNWVKKQTSGKISDLLPEGSISIDTRLVLANAVYFNAAWMYQFSKESVQSRPFTLLSGEQTEAPMMQREMKLKHTVGQGYQAVELPYVGNDVSMVAIMPDSGTFSAFEDRLDAKTFSDIVRGLSVGKVDLSLPKFAFEAGINLNDTLTTMGMTDALEPSLADFSGITGGRDLYVSNVLHKALIAIDEKGTEAAAATAIVADTVSAPLQPEQVVSITFDHPFIFAIRDMETGALLFVGRVLDPGA